MAIKKKLEFTQLMKSLEINKPKLKISKENVLQKSADMRSNKNAVK